MRYHQLTAPFPVNDDQRFEFVGHALCLFKRIKALEAQGRRGLAQKKNVYLHDFYMILLIFLTLAKTLILCSFFSFSFIKQSRLGRAITTSDYDSHYYSLHIPHTKLASMVQRTMRMEHAIFRTYTFKLVDLVSNFYLISLLTIYTCSAMYLCLELKL